MLDTCPEFVGLTLAEPLRSVSEVAWSGPGLARQIGPRFGTLGQIRTAFFLSILETDLDSIRFAESSEMALERRATACSCGDLWGLQRGLCVGDLENDRVGPAPVRIQPLRSKGRDVKSV